MSSSLDRLSGLEIDTCFLLGSGLARDCVRGFDEVEKIWSDAICSLDSLGSEQFTPAFKQEIIYFRIFTVYHIFYYVFYGERFNFFWNGFQVWLRGYWDREEKIFDEIHFKLYDYSSSLDFRVDNFRVTNASNFNIEEYFKAYELLINAGFLEFDKPSDVDELVKLCRVEREMEHIFKWDCLELRKRINKCISWIYGDEEQLYEKFDELPNLPPIYYHMEM